MLGKPGSTAPRRRQLRALTWLQLAATVVAMIACDRVLVHPDGVLSHLVAWTILFVLMLPVGLPILLAASVLAYIADAMPWMPSRVAFLLPWPFVIAGFVWNSRIWARYWLPILERRWGGCVTRF